MFKKKNLIFTLFIISFIFLTASSVQAQAGGSNSGAQIQNPIKADTLAELLADILSIIVQIGIPILVIMVIFTGFTFVMARGNEAKITQAKTAIFSVLIGSAIVIGAYAISEAIRNTVNDLQRGTPSASQTNPVGGIFETSD